MNFKKIKDVKSPRRAYNTDAGIDFYIPNSFKETLVSSNSSILIESGIIAEIPKGYAGLFLNKSGIASKKSLILGAQVIDSSYRGEILINLHNIGKGDVVLKAGMKIVQMLIIPINLSQPTEVTEFIKEETERGTGGFGSTDSERYRITYRTKEGVYFYEEANKLEYYKWKEKAQLDENEVLCVIKG